MSNFRGYYMKCNNCTFQNPSFKREGFKFAPKLVQVADATTTASGNLSIKVLPHVRSKIWCSFPPMTPEQFRTYYSALDNMYLEVEYYNEDYDRYETATMYHTDLTYKPITYEGRRMIDFQQFSLIEH